MAWRGQRFQSAGSTSVPAKPFESRHQAYQERIPDEHMSSRISQRRPLRQGFFIGDGSVKTASTKPRSLAAFFRGRVGDIIP